MTGCSRFLFRRAVCMCPEIAETWRQQNDAGRLAMGASLLSPGNGAGAFLVAALLRIGVDVRAFMSSNAPLAEPASSSSAGTYSTACATPYVSIFVSFSFLHASLLAVFASVTCSRR